MKEQEEFEAMESTLARFSSDGYKRTTDTTISDDIKEDKSILKKVLSTDDDAR